LNQHTPKRSTAKELVRLSGRFRILFLYDVAEVIDLKMLRSLVGARGGPVERIFPRGTPEYVRLEETPIVEPAESLSIGRDITAACSVKYYPFGVVVVQVEVPFDCNWQLLLAQNSRWIDATDLDKDVREVARRRLDRVAGAVVRPTKEWLQEIYLVTEINEIRNEHGEQPTADELLVSHGGEIVQLVRGETAPLAGKACEEVLQTSLSYYPRDLVVVGSSAAVVYDRSEDAAVAAHVLEYAKMQLLEFRYYDRLMTEVLTDFYDVLERKRSVLFSRWSLPRDAQRFNTVQLDVMELTERIDNAIKFVSDIYYARVYKVAATRVGVPDYRTLVKQKLRTVGGLYDFLIDQFNEARSFVLEVGVAILAALDVILLLRGK
jgi:hypothetical protein